MNIHLQLSALPSITSRLRPLALALAALLVALVGEHVPGRLGLDTLDDAARSSSARSLESTATVFATARAANALLSVGRSFSVGAGVSISPGEVLDPLDRLIDELNDWLLWAVTAAALTNLLVLSCGSISLLGLVMAVTVMWLGLHYAVRLGACRRLGAHQLLRGLIALLLLARVGLPIAVWSADRCSDFFTTGAFLEAMADLGKIGAPIANFELSLSGSPAMLDGIRTAVSAIAIDPRRFFVSVATVAGVIALRTVVLPVLLTVVMWRIARFTVALSTCRSSR